MGMPVKVDAEEGEISAVRTLRKSGNSVVVSVPPEVLEQAGMGRGDTVSIVAAFGGEEITVRKGDSDDTEVETPPDD